MHYDIIGDIHGHAIELEELLEKMGYQLSGDGLTYQPPKGHQAIFVGDLIDRGDEIHRVLEIVYHMVKRGDALITMGNHEYNAICYYTKYNDEYLRPHDLKNNAQIAATDKFFRENPELKKCYLACFREMPLYLDLGELRIVHACWNQVDIEIIGERKLSDFEFLKQTTDPKTPEHRAIENILKGPELKLPDQLQFKDKDNHTRTAVRVKWWGPLQNRSYRDLAFPPTGKISAQTLPPPRELPEIEPYFEDFPPVFFGHYWLEAQKPSLVSPNLTCLDYSVANEKCPHRFLAAYRWQGESTLNADHFFTYN
jgi:hypothetical protein